MEKLCSIDGCFNKHEAKGFCNMHYIRYRKLGDPGKAERLVSAKGSGRYIDKNGYVISSGKKRLHVLIAESALGKNIPKDSVVHHVNEDKLDNRNSNLVICENRAYHNIIHARTRAYNETGDPNKMKCPFCGKYDSPENMYVYKNKYAAKHRKCYREYRAGRRNKVNNLGKLV